MNRQLYLSFPMDFYPGLLPQRKRGAEGCTEGWNQGDREARRNMERFVVSVLWFVVVGIFYLT